MSRVPHLGGLDSIASAGQGGDDSEGWEISRTKASFSVNSQEASPNALCFSADGAKMFVAGSTSDAIFEYTLATPFDISTASYSGSSLSVSSQAGNAHALAASGDGTRLYVLDTTTASIYQYTLPTPWSLSGASYASKSFNVGNGPRGFAFSADGAKMVVSTVTGAASLRRYSLSTAWDVSTASADGSNVKNIAADTTTPYGIAMRPDGARVYLIDAARDRVIQYNLSAALDLTAASYAGTFGVADTTEARDIAFAPDGKAMFVMDAAADTVFQYRI